MATGGQASEVCYPIPEMEEIAWHGLNARERQPFYPQNGGGGGNGVNQSMLNGGEVISREEFSMQEPAACQLVNGQQQPPRSLQCAQANGMRYSTQDVGQDPSQRWGRQEIGHPIQETGRFAERKPDEHEDLPSCHQQLNGADLNGVSSTSDREQAVEYTCSRQELKLWKQELDRQACVSYCTLHLYGK